MTLDEMISDLYYVVHKSQMATLELGDESARQLLRWLEDYKELKEDYIELDRKLREANSSLMEVQMIAHHSDWIPCGERLPEDGERILIYVHLASHDSVQPDTCIEDGGYMYLDSGYSFGKEVTHWMPLPSPPKEVNEDGRRD